MSNPVAKPNMSAYNKAVRTARTASANVGKAGWIIGDAALSVETEYGQNTLKRFADDISVELSTVRNFRTMAARYPVTEISRDLQSATVYGIFVSQDDAHDLVKAGNDGNPWTVSAARALVQSRKSGSETDPEGNSETGPEGNGETDPRDALVRNIERLKVQLADAQAKLDEYDASHKTVTVHSPAGVPQHDASDPQPACPDCQKAGTVPATVTPARRPSAATRKAARAAADAAKLAKVA